MAARAIVGRTMPNPFAPAQQPLDPAAEKLVELVYDRHLILQEVLPSERFLGWAPQEILGTPFSATGLPLDGIRQLVDQALANGDGEVRGSVPLVHRDGSQVVGFMVTRILIDADGEFAGLHARLQIT